MNKTGIIKTAFLIIFALPTLIVPLKINLSQGYIITILPPLIIGFLFLLFSVRHTKQLVEPSWSANLFKRENILSRYQFISCFFITVGFSIMIGTRINFGLINGFGLTNIAFGIGLLAGTVVKSYASTKN